MRFLKDNAAVRITLKQGQNYWHIDVNVNEQTSSIAQADNFGISDLTVFAAVKDDPYYQDQVNRLNEKL